MKKIILCLLTFCSIAINAQTTLTTAVDFTAKDIEGNTFNLFSKLGEGKYVLIDFFFTNCGPCQNTAPKLHEAFMTYGANNPDAQVYFVSINRDDNNAVMQSWESTYMNPTGPYPKGISGTEGSATGGPQSFSATYGITAYPTMILIAPDLSIVEQDIWPIGKLMTLIHFLPLMVLRLLLLVFRILQLIITYQYFHLLQKSRLHYQLMERN